MIDKTELSEQDIRSKYILRALKQAGWDVESPLVREEFPITAGRIIAKAQVCKRDKPLRADYVLFLRPNVPLAVIEAKDNNHTVGDGIQQAIKYAQMLNVPFAFSSNGDGFLFHNELADEGEPIERELSLDRFPSPEALIEMYDRRLGLTDDQKRAACVPYYADNPNKTPRYYQCVAVNRVVDAIAGGEKRALLVMATGTGKTYTAFQIIWHLWKAGVKKRILFLVDRKSLASQTINNDFAPFGDKMMWVKKNNFDTAHEIHIGLYQGLTNDDDADSEDAAALFKNFSKDFFDLIIVDECHRGSIKENSRWRSILEYFSSAAQIGMTATPKETSTLSTIEYFGEPIYEYSLKQGIDDGYLAPYRVIRVIFDKDADGFTPYEGQLDDNGEIIDNRTFNTSDFDRSLILEKRTRLVAKTVSDYLKKNNCRMDKSIFFCVDQNHAERMRAALIAENPDLVKEDPRYVMRITANDEFGVKELDNFQNPESKYPVLVTTSKLLSTGVDVKTCKFIVLDSNIRSMIEFKQIIGRGTRVLEEQDKLYFTIFDFRGVTRLFHDPDFDGPIEQDDEYRPGQGGDDDPPPPPEVPPKPKKIKFVLGDEPVTAIARTIHYRNAEGQLVVENVETFTRRCVKDKFESLQSFLAIWRGADRKELVIGELEREGVSFADLAEQLDADIDPFDLICHIVYNRPPLTRAERAKNVRKRDIFGKYGETAAKVLDAILDKYASKGIGELETDEDKILSTDPINDFGSPVQIVRAFGGIDNFRTALHELSDAIYAEA